VYDMLTPMLIQASYTARLGYLLAIRTILRNQIPSNALLTYHHIDTRAFEGKQGIRRVLFLEIYTQTLTAAHMFHNKSTDGH